MSPSSQGGGKVGSGLLSHVEQSLPSTGSGQGSQKGWDELQPGPRQREGIGILAHVDPRGIVPVLTKVPLIGYLVPFENTSSYLSTIKSSGIY